MKKWGHLQNWGSYGYGPKKSKTTSKVNLSIDQRAAAVQRMLESYDGKKIENASVLLGARQGPPPSPSPTPSFTPTASVTPTFTPTSTITPTPTITPTETNTPTPTITSTITPTPSATPVFYYILAENTDILQAENGDFLEKEQLT
jgi:hypothetical protein